MRIFLLTLLLLSALGITAQNVEFEKENFNYKENKEAFKAAVKALEAGDKLFEASSDNYEKALPYYLEAQKFNPNNALLNYKIGVCLLSTIHKTECISYFERAFKLDPNIDPRIHFMLGTAYQLVLNWDKAKSEYNIYRTSLPPEELKAMDKILAKKTEECNNGIELMKKPARVFIDNLGSVVNSRFGDYSPTIAPDESLILFTSRRDVSMGAKEAQSADEYDEDVYISYKEKGKWQPVKNMGPPINSVYHDATIGLATDGQSMLMYKGDNGGDIYECTLKGKEWSKPVKLNKAINTENHESSACYSFDGQILYFVSDRPGGYGGRDIYMSRLQKKGKWGDAINLGPVINTEYDEEGVFMHPDGKTMYFSSKGHKTMGGYDIFKTIWNDSLKSWSAPENIGYPINTADDDVFFVVSGNGRHGYFASVKNDGLGEKDIYVVTFLGPEKPGILSNEDNLIACLTEPVKEKQIEKPVEIKTAQLTIFKGRVLDAVTMQPVEANIELTDNVKNQPVSTFQSNASTGKYLVALPSGRNYGIAVKADGYLFHSENFDIPQTSSYQEVTKDILLKKVEVGTRIILRNIFFDFDKATLRPESTAELERLITLLNENGSLKIEISGHTDNRGSAVYNQKLSEDRAKAVVDYLVKKGINSNRLEFKGYGLTQPVETNDTDYGRQQNRRTEFKILSK